jgi:hypothetical protein
VLAKSKKNQKSVSLKNQQAPQKNSLVKFASSKKRKYRKSKKSRYFQGFLARLIGFEPMTCCLEVIRITFHGVHRGILLCAETPCITGKIVGLIPISYYAVSPCSTASNSLLLANC